MLALAAPCGACIGRRDARIQPCFAAGTNGSAHVAWGETCGSSKSSFLVDLQPSAAVETGPSGWICALWALPPQSGDDGLGPPFVGPLKLNA